MFWGTVCSCFKVQHCARRSAKLCCHIRVFVAVVVLLFSHSLVFFFFLFLFLSFVFPLLGVPKISRQEEYFKFFFCQHWGHGLHPRQECDNHVFSHWHEKAQQLTVIFPNFPQTYSPPIPLLLSHSFTNIFQGRANVQFSFWKFYEVRLA